MSNAGLAAMLNFISRLTIREVLGEAFADEHKRRI
jgi:hypothetical protein